MFTSVWYYILCFCSKDNGSTYIFISRVDRRFYRCCLNRRVRIGSSSRMEYSDSPVVCVIDDSIKLVYFFACSKRSFH